MCLTAENFCVKTKFFEIKIFYILICSRHSIYFGFVKCKSVIFVCKRVLSFFNYNNLDVRVGQNRATQRVTGDIFYDPVIH